MDGVPPDALTLWNQMKNEEKEMRQKRRLLMGFSAPELSSRKRSKSNEQSMLPETILREDDLFFENLKKIVEKGFGGCHDEESEFPATEDKVEHVAHQKILKTVLALLDDFTNNGLYLLAKLIGGSSVIEKTRWKMKTFIKENLPKVHGKQCNSGKEDATYSKLSHILTDPHNFRKSHVMTSTRAATWTVGPSEQSHYAATMTILDGLEKMSLQTLSAMYRRLTGAQCNLPTLNPPRCGWSIGRLVRRVKSLSLKMLSEVDKSDGLPEPLAKAMEVASLSLKLSGHQNAFLTNFCHYTPEIESLHHDIIKAINLLDRKVGVEELKSLKNALAPHTEYQVVNGGLRKAVKKMLTEFLFECGDMDEIPAVLLDSLAVINRCAVPKKEVNEEVESILNVSAQLKQVLWDIIPDDKLDLDFADAYMEDLEDSDEDFYDDYGEEGQLLKDESDEVSEVGSTGVSDDADSSLLFCTPTSDIHNRSNGKSDSVLKSEIKVDPDDLLFTPSSFGVSQSYNHTTSMSSKLHEGETLTHMTEAKSSVSRFSLFSAPNDQIEERKHNQSRCKIEPIDLAEDCEGNSCEKVKDMSETPCTSGNKYLAIQEVCDEASLIAYRLIGRVFEGFASIQGIDLDERQLSYLNGGHPTPVGSKGINSSCLN
nr:DNA double-strand break repair [Fagopyrum tataricum]